MGSATNDRPNLDTFCFRRGRLSPVVSMVLEPPISPLNIVWLRPSQLKATSVDDDWNVVMRPDLQPVLTFLCRNCSLLFSTVVSAKPNVDMNRPVSGRTSTMYV